MKFDVCIKNPPYNKGNTYLNITKKILEISNKTISVMPMRIIKHSYLKKFEKYLDDFDKQLVETFEKPSYLFKGTAMNNVYIYCFDKNKNTNNITINNIDGTKNVLKSIKDVSTFSEYEQHIVKYLEKPGQQLIVWAGGTLKYKKQISNLSKDELEEYYILKINKNSSKLEKYYQQKDYCSLVVNCVNGKMNGTFFSIKVGQIFSSYKDILDFFINRKTSSGYNIILFTSKTAAENCKLALQRPLLRFTLYRLQIDQNMYISKVYKYVPAIDWEDQRCLTDEGILEICGCPSDKAKEYAQYCKQIIDEVDNKNKKK